MRELRILQDASQHLIEQYSPKHKADFRWAMAILSNAQREVVNAYVAQTDSMEE